MKKLKLEIIGLSYSENKSGAYALVLGETKGERRLPIIIGSYEAQAIAIELEKMTPGRPLTHDLFKTFADSFDITVKEIIIYNLVEGIFYAKLICNKDGKEIEIDARTSDSIALAIRFKCPIYTYEFILAAAGISLENPEEKGTLEFQIEESTKGEDIGDVTEDKDNLHSLTLEKLKALLAKAISEEAYDQASAIRDEIDKRCKKS